MIDGKSAVEFLGRGGTEMFLSDIAKKPTFENNHISTQNKIMLIQKIIKEKK